MHHCIVVINHMSKLIIVDLCSLQCFCFEEQRLNPREEVDMPVFFYIDPEFVEDHRLVNCDQVLLCYTFFEAKEGVDLPLPVYMTQAVTQ